MAQSVRSFLGALWKKIYLHRKFLLGLGVFIIVIGAVSAVIATPAHAQLPGTGSVGVGDIFSVDGWKRIISSILLEVANFFLRISLFFLSLILQISSYNGYLDSTAVNVGWVMVRDITNMFFVAVMLLIAFGTILGLEQYEWKKLMVKFIIAAVFVNFSRTVCGIFIDLSQLVMTTFVNGIAATAGGNLINMFNLDKITKLSASANPSMYSGGMFIASVAALTFSALVMYTLGVFVFMLVARLIRLWVLIVLSPVAFVLGVVPMTQQFASQWWKELADDLVTGPVLLFFMWLSFVTVGTGQINTEIAGDRSVPQELKIEDESVLDADKLQGQTTGIGDAMSWNKMANFAIAIGMLLAGARVASTIGGSSGSALSGVAGFGKKVATIASGVAVGQWLGGKAKQGGVAALQGAGWLAKNTAIPFTGGSYAQHKQKIIDFAKTQKKAYENKRLEGFTAREKRVNKTAIKRNGGLGDEEMVSDEDLQRMKDANEDFRYVTEGGGVTNIPWFAKKRSDYVREKIKMAEFTNEDNVETESRDAAGNYLDKDNNVVAAGKNANGDYVDTRGNIIKDAKSRIHVLDKEMLQNERGEYLDEKGNVVAVAKDASGKFINADGQVISEDERKKIYIPPKKQKKVNGRVVFAEKEGKVLFETEEDMAKRNSILGNMEGKKGLGILRGFGRGLVQSYFASAGKRNQALIESAKKLKKTENYGKNLEDLVNVQTSGVPSGFFLAQNDWIDGEDRATEGRIKAEKARSSAKTEEHSGYGEQATLASARFKDGKFQSKGGTLAEQIAAHKSAAAATAADIQAISEQAKAAFAKGDKGQKNLQAKVYADLKLKTAQAQNKMFEGSALTKMQKMPEGLKEIAKAIEQEKQAHTEHEKQEQIKKEEERKYTQSHHGRHEAAEEAELKAKMTLDEAIMKDVHAKAKLEFVTKSGKKIEQEVADLEVATKIADEFVKAIKNDHTRDMYLKANAVLRSESKEEIEKLIKSGNIIGRYIESSKVSATSRENERLTTLAKDDAQNRADALYVDQQTRGYAFQSDAYGNYIKSEASKVTAAGDQGRAEFLSRNAAFVARRRQEAAVDATKALTEEEVAASAVTMIGVANGCNLDDGQGNLSAKLNLVSTEAGRAKYKRILMDIEKKSATEADEVINGYQDLLVDLKSMGHVKKRNDGTLRIASNARTEREMAMYMATGGDVQMVRAHQEIERYMTEHPKITDYEDAAEAFFSDSKERTNTQGLDSKEFFKRIDQRQGIFATVQEEFRKSGVAGGHFQMVGALKKSDKSGRVLFATEAQARSEENTQKGKNQDTKVAPHTFATMSDTEVGFWVIDAKRLATSNMSGFTSVTQFKNRGQERSVRAVISSSGPGKKDDETNFAMIGGSVEDIKARGEDSELAGLTQVINNTLKVALKNAKTVALAAAADIGHITDIQAEDKGLINATIVTSDELKNQLGLTTISGAKIDKFFDSVLENAEKIADQLDIKQKHLETLAKDGKMDTKEYRATAMEIAEIKELKTLLDQSSKIKANAITASKETNSKNGSADNKNTERKQGV